MSNARNIRSADKPAGVSLNLDTLEAEVTAEPFVLVVQGERFEFADPQDMVWTDVNKAMQDPSGQAIFELALTPDEHAKFIGLRLTMRQINRVASEYMKHYGMDPGNQGASLA